MNTCKECCNYCGDYTPFDVLDEISSSYYGKQMFFLQENGTVYDRMKCDYITFEEAVSRMAQLLSDDGEGY